MLPHPIERHLVVVLEESSESNGTDTENRNGTVMRFNSRRWDFTSSPSLPSFSDDEDESENESDDDEAKRSGRIRTGDGEREATKREKALSFVLSEEARDCLNDERRGRRQERYQHHRPPCLVRGMSGLISTVSSDSIIGSSAGSRRSENSKSVQFGSIHIRDYNRTVGDHPDCPLGPPLSLDWDYEERDPISVDAFEMERRHNSIGGTTKEEEHPSSSSSSSSHSTTGCSPSSREGPEIISHDDHQPPQQQRQPHPRRRRRRPGSLDPMSSIIRKNLLHYEFGVPMDDLRSAEAAVRHAMKERQETRHQHCSLLWDRAGEMVKSAKQNVRKMMEEVTK